MLEGYCKSCQDPLPADEAFNNRLCDYCRNPVDCEEAELTFIRLELVCEGNLAELNRFGEAIQRDGAVKFSLSFDGDNADLVPAINAKSMEIKPRVAQNAAFMDNQYTGNAGATFFSCTNFSGNMATDPDRDHRWEIRRIVPLETVNVEIRSYLTELQRFYQLMRRVNELVIKCVEHGLGDITGSLARMTKLDLDLPFTSDKAAVVQYPPGKGLKSHGDLINVFSYAFHSEPGLEIFVPKAGWRKLTLGPDEGVAYAGDLLTHLSGHRIPTLWHRVIRPASVTERVAVLYQTMLNLEEPVVTIGGEDSVSFAGYPIRDPFLLLFALTQAPQPKVLDAAFLEAANRAKQARMVSEAQMAQVLSTR